MKALTLALGAVYGQLTVVSHKPGGIKGRNWICICSCGKEYLAQAGYILNGRVRSCGCFARSKERARAIGHRNTTHGKSHGQGGSRAYGVWRGLRKRCHLEKHPDYADYGGRGITVCERWDTSFENFLADMGEPGPNMSIGRRDNDGPYSPENCSWENDFQQNNNRPRFNRRLIAFGESKTLAEWRRDPRTRVSTVSWLRRLRAGWTPEKALTTPPTNNPTKLELR